MFSKFLFLNESEGSCHSVRVTLGAELWPSMAARGWLRIIQQLQPYPPLLAGLRGVPPRYLRLKKSHGTDLAEGGSLWRFYFQGKARL